MFVISIISVENSSHIMFLQLVMMILIIASNLRTSTGAHRSPWEPVGFCQCTLGPPGAFVRSHLPVGVKKGSIRLIKMLKSHLCRRKPAGADGWFTFDLYIIAAMFDSCSGAARLMFVVASGKMPQYKNFKISKFKFALITFPSQTLR